MHKAPLHSATAIEEAFTSLLKRCSTHRHLLQIEAQVAAHGLQHHHYLTPRILAASFALSSPQHATLRFRTTHLTANPIPWNVMFKGYTQLGSHARTLTLFDEMRLRDVKPNGYTFTFVLKSCAEFTAVEKAETVHCLAVRRGLLSNLFVGTGLVDVYGAVGMVGRADKLFDEMRERNVVAWTAIVRAHVSAGDLVGASLRFDGAEEHDVVLWNIMLSGYLKVKDVDGARELFNRMPHRDLMVWNTMLHGYANGGDLGACVRFFDIMPDRNDFSWNGLICGYMCHGKFSEALLAFSNMLGCSNAKPNEATLVTVLSACSKLGALDQGKWVHAYAFGNGFRSSVNLNNTLIDMYAKCGSVETAFEVFDGMNERDVVSWNVMIGGLAMHGYGNEALRVFDLMRSEGHDPDGITLLGVLSACSHMGLIQEGLDYFRLLIREYSLTPCLEHYGCIVDLLGRSGMLEEALQFITAMPIEADCVIWSSLLSASRIFGNVYLAELATEQLVKLQPSDAANYVALSNVYGMQKRWGDVAMTMHMLRKNHAEKLPGCSSIDISGEVVEFYSFDGNHPYVEEIYDVIRRLSDLSKLISDVFDVDEHFEMCRN